MINIFINIHLKNYGQFKTLYLQLATITIILGSIIILNSKCDDSKYFQYYKYIVLEKPNYENYQS